ncbi:MAG: hypothetical protein ACLU4N_04455 [Butyricimonas faecihominis]
MDERICTFYKLYAIKIFVWLFWFNGFFSVAISRTYTFGNGNVYHGSIAATIRGLENLI